MATETAVGPATQRSPSSAEQAVAEPEPGVDAVESALVQALTRAAEAGRFDVVAQLAKELEARRLGRAGNNVVALDRGTRRGA